MARREGWKDRRRISKQLSQEAWSVYSDNEPLRQYALRAFIWGALLGFATIIVAGGVAALGYLASEWVAIIGIVPLFLGSWLTAYVVYRFSAAITAETASIFDGRGADFDRGLRVAAEHGRAISRWALIQVIVGWILSAARDAASDNGIAAIIVAIITAIIGIIWALITFFVLPVILFEHTGAIEAIKRSKDLARGQWGKQVRGVVRITIRGALLFVLPGVVFIVAGVVMVITGNPGLIVGGVVLAAIGVVLVIMGSIRIMAARLIFGVALYRYATAQGPLGPFDADMIGGSVRTR